MRTTSLVQIHTIFAKPYIFYESPIRMNLYEWPTPNPAPKPTLHWGLDKSYKWGYTMYRQDLLWTDKFIYVLCWFLFNSNIITWITVKLLYGLLHLYHSPTEWGGICMQMNHLPAGGAAGEGELQVSPVTLYTKPH